MDKVGKKKIGLALALCLCFTVWNGCGSRVSSQPETLRIGVAVYNGRDKFLEGVRSQIEKIVACQDSVGPQIQVEIVDSESRQALQNEQVENLIREEYDVICVNLVERTNAAVIAQLAEDAEIPLIFFNREPLKEDICDRGQVYYIGADAAISAKMQAQIVIDAYREEPGSIDKNGDGRVQYAMLEGEMGHQDSIIRTERSVEELEDAGLCLEKAASGCANFERGQAAALVERWIKEDLKIELILSNNDDMALGAIDALEEYDLLGQVTVVGIDGTQDGKAAVDQGKMLGTVESDGELYAKTLYEAACCLAEGKELDTCMELEDDRYLWIPWEYYGKEPPKTAVFLETSINILDFAP